MILGVCTTIDNYRAVAQLGYDFIELSGYEVAHMSEPEINEATALLKRQGIPCLAINAYCREELPIVGSGFNPDNIRIYAALVSARAARLGAKTLGIGSPAARQLPAGYSNELADNQMRQFLSITAQEAAKHDLWVLYEPLNPHICQYGLSTAHGVDLVRSVGEANVGLVLDYHHMAITSEAMEDLGFAIPLTRHLHINHVGGDNRKHYMTETDLPSAVNFLAAARRLGYRGTLSVEAECEDSGFAQDAGHTLQVLRKALKQIDATEPKENER
ncbi:MAG: sugar phosphate isomerase/epimerase family protein [Clostridiales bacterium]